MSILSLPLPMRSRVPDATKHAIRRAPWRIRRTRMQGNRTGKRRMSIRQMQSPITDHVQLAIDIAAKNIEGGAAPAGLWGLHGSIDVSVSRCLALPFDLHDLIGKVEESDFASKVEESVHGVALHMRSTTLYPYPLCRCAVPSTLSWRCGVALGGANDSSCTLLVNGRSDRDLLRARLQLQGHDNLGYQYYIIKWWSQSPCFMAIEMPTTSEKFTVKRFHSTP